MLGQTSYSFLTICYRVVTLITPYKSVFRTESSHNVKTKATQKQVEKFDLKSVYSLSLFRIWTIAERSESTCVDGANVRLSVLIP